MHCLSRWQTTCKNTYPRFQSSMKLLVCYAVIVIRAYRPNACRGEQSVDSTNIEGCDNLRSTASSKEEVLATDKPVLDTKSPNTSVIGGCTKALTEIVPLGAV